VKKVLPALWGKVKKSQQGQLNKPNLLGSEADGIIVVL